MSDLNLFAFAHSVNKKYKFLISKKFKTNADITQRTIEVADSFGLGIDDDFEFVIFDNFQLGFNDGDIVYITGDSGSGKSILLKEIMNKLSETDYIHEKNLDINPDETLIEGIGKDINTALSILSIVGLNDAFLYLRKYNQLSDGQKLRYKLAKMIDSNKNIFIFDEYCATLDRETAKIISFNIQKYMRKNKKILIVATTHNDLIEDLSPNVYVYKKFNNNYIVDYSDKVNTKCSIIKDILIKELDSVDRIVDLEKFHYRSEVNSYKSIWGCYLNKELVACMVIAYPLIQLKGRNTFLPGKFSTSSTENMNILNREVECISRVIVHPKYRGVGLAYTLIAEYLQKYTKARYVETIAVMPKYNPFFQKAGMKLIEYDRTDERYNEMINELVSLGFDRTLLKSYKYIQKIYSTLDEIKRKKFEEIVTRLTERYNGISGGTGRFIVNEKMFENKEFCLLLRRLIKSELQYLVYDNSDKFVNEVKVQKSLC